MADRVTDSTTITWSVPQCPFTIESSARVLDDIRLAVSDAFFSLPRGGAEIGGILLGAFDNGRLLITDHASLECEHAHGPSFTLSVPDEVRLSGLIQVHSGGPTGIRPVGWYHSHTRSEIFLSEADLELYRRFFPDPWQVALVIKPHTFQPSRFGFFFREKDGTVHASESYREGVLESQPARQVPSAPPPSDRPQPRNLRPASGAGPVVEIAPAAVSTSTLPPVAQPSHPTPEPAHPVPFAPAARTAADESALLPEELAAPKFLVESASSARSWLTVTIGLVAVLGVVGTGFTTRDLWLPQALAALRPALAAVRPATGTAPPLGLTTTDRAGQLQVNWDRNSVSVRGAAGGVLEINEGGPVPTVIPLDAAHLQAGSFTYARNAEKVDIKLILHRKDAPDLRDATSFLGKLPVPDPEAERKREELEREAAKMKADLSSQAAKTKKLEKDIESMREEMRQQQQRRLANQIPDK